jgi:hypothetical protein
LAIALHGQVLPSGRGVEDRIVIAASPQAIWDKLADLNAWKQWNPLYVEAEGNLHVGARLDLAVALAGMKPRKAKAVVQKVEPGRFVQYEIVNLGGLVRATRYIALLPVGTTQIEVVNGEIMGGPLGQLLARAVGEKVRTGLAGMNRALKTLVESGP